MRVFPLLRRTLRAFFSSARLALVNVDEMRHDSAAGCRDARAGREVAMLLVSAEIINSVACVVSAGTVIGTCLSSACLPLHSMSPCR